MLLSHRVRVFARSGPTDLRLGFSGLAGLVSTELGQDLLAGDLFLFVSRRRESAKMLCWDGTGLCLYTKKLAKGRFAAVWERSRGGAVSLSAGELSLFLEGAALPLGTATTRPKKGGLKGAKGGRSG